MTTLRWKVFSRNEILFGLLLPVVFGVLILLWPYIMNALVGPPTTMIGGILTVGFLQIICISAIPVFLGLTWNNWAGGASGFLLGFIYFILVMVYYGISGEAIDVSWRAYIVAAMVGGFVAGSLIRDSSKLKRNLLVAIIVGILQGSILLWTYDLVYHSFTGFPGGPLADLAGIHVPLWSYISFITFVPPLLGCIIAAIIAKVFAWAAMSPRLLKQYAS